MNLAYKQRISVEDYNALRDAVGWGRLCEDQAAQSLENSAFVISCYDGEKIAGAARLIWDRGATAYLADVMVMPAYQRQGIGTYMVEENIAFLKSQLREGWRIKIVLIAAKGKEAFYEKFGFCVRPNENAGPGMDLILT